MKKLFSTLLFAATALFTPSCDVIEDLAGEALGGTDGAIEYVGSIAVSKGETPTYVDTDVEFSIEVENGSATIIMLGVCFDEAMAGHAMDITASGILATQGVFTADSVVPTIGGTEHADRTLTNIAGTYTDSNMGMKFDCGDYTVVYAGVVKE